MNGRNLVPPFLAQILVIKCGKISSIHHCKYELLNPNLKTHALYHQEPRRDISRIRVPRLFTRSFARRRGFNIMVALVLIYMYICICIRTYSSSIATWTILEASSQFPQPLSIPSASAPIPHHFPLRRCLLLESHPKP